MMIKREKPAPESAAEEHLPSRRTFLLRFSNATRPEAGIYHGRVEHIDTGRTMRFTSLQEITEFVDEIMTVDEGETEISYDQEIS